MTQTLSRSACSKHARLPPKHEPMLQSQHGRGHRSVCFIDVENEVAAAAGSQQATGGGCRGLVWLAGSDQLLAVVRNATIHLFSIAASLEQVLQDRAAGKGHSLHGTIAAQASVTAICAAADSSELLVATGDSTLSCYSVQAAAAPPRGSASLWQAPLPVPHDLLASCSAAHGVAASASTQEAAIAIWRGTTASSAPAQAADWPPAPDWLKIPSPATCLALQPPPPCSRRTRAGATGAACVLMAACADGCVRLWVDTNLADTLPPGFTVHDNASSSPLGHTMCLAHVLSVPGVAVGGPQAPLTATWAAPPSAQHAQLGMHARRTSWLVATRCSGSAAQHEAPAQAGHAADELFVWAVTVDQADADAAAMGTGSEAEQRSGVSVSVSVSQATPDSKAGGKARSPRGQLGAVAACRSPKVSAALWGRDSEQVRLCTGNSVPRLCTHATAVGGQLQ